MPSIVPEPQRASTAPADELDDEAVVARVLAGECTLYELIMRRYNQRLYRIVRGMLDDDAETEDALQECYLHAFQHLDQFRGEAKFSTWLARIAVHEASRRQKRRGLARQRTRALDAFGEHHCTFEDRFRQPPQNTLENNELRHVLTDCIEQLPAQLRTVLILRDIEELDTRDTAECLDVSEENVRIMLHRARGLLRKDIDQRLGSEVRVMYQFGAERCDRVVHAVMQAIARLT